MVSTNLSKICSQNVRPDSCIFFGLRLGCQSQFTMEFCLKGILKTSQGDISQRFFALSNQNFYIELFGCIHS